MAAGASATLWLPDGKHRKVAATITPARALTLRAEDGGAMAPLPLAAITIANLGNPAGMKRSMFGRAPKAANSVVVEPAQGTPGAAPYPLHIEFDDEKALRQFVTALRALAPEVLVTQG
jgi:hypothetical protein